MAVDPKPFVVSAQCRGDRRVESRAAAASAMVLADLRAEEGCHGIRLVDREGVAREREAFRSSLMRQHKLGRHEHAR